MAKGKQVFFCQECGFESTKWMGQCPGCKAWNSFCEEKVTVGAKSQSGRRAVVALQAFWRWRPPTRRVLPQE